MWSAVAARRLGFISRRELVARLSRTLDDARAHGALRGHGPVLQLVRPPHRREAHRLAAATAGPSSTRSCPPSTTAGSPWASRSSRARVPELSRRARGALRGDGLRLLLRARAQPGAVPLPPRRPRGVALLLRHAWSARAASSTTSASAAGSCREKELLRALAHLPGHLRLLLPGDASRSAAGAATSASTSSRAPTSTTASSSCPPGAARCSRR